MTIIQTLRGKRSFEALTLLGILISFNSKYRDYILAKEFKVSLTPLSTLTYFITKKKYALMDNLYSDYPIVLKASVFNFHRESF